MKKVLFVASVYKFLKFEVNDMKLLKSKGFEIHTATNMNEADWLKDNGDFDFLNLIKHQIDFGRTPFSVKNFKAYKQIKKLLKTEKFDLIHCHTPVAAAIARFAAKKYRKCGLKVIYTCHGFHFHQKSSKINWLLYYPIEKILARYTDMIITINKEDYKIIKKFKTPEKRYIPGVGVDTNYIYDLPVNTSKIRNDIGLKENDFMILSVGELSKRKNHEVIIKALANINASNIFYVICGTGNLENYLKCLANSLGVEKKVIFLGQQPYNRVIELQKASNIGALPSVIEGLGLAGIETLAAAKPIIASKVHGINDYVIDYITGIGCEPYDVNEFKNAIEKLKNDSNLYTTCSKNAKSKSSEFDIKIVSKLMSDNYDFFSK